MSQSKENTPQVGDIFSDPLSKTNSTIVRIEGKYAYSSLLRYPVVDLCAVEKKDGKAVWTLCDTTRREIVGVYTPADAFAGEMYVALNPMDYDVELNLGDY